LDKVFFIFSRNVDLFFRVTDPDPDWIGFNQVSGSGSGTRRAKKTQKSRHFLEISCFEVLDVLF
jgi:hypothetical protein